jgi:hypothetical protein
LVVLPLEIAYYLPFAWQQRGTIFKAAIKTAPGRLAAAVDHASNDVTTATVADTTPFCDVNRKKYLSDGISCVLRRFHW